MTIKLADAVLHAALAARGSLHDLGTLLRAMVNGEVLNPLPVGAGAGVTSGAGGFFSIEQERRGTLVKTRIFIDLTGLASSTTDLDVIGVGASAAYLAQLKAAAHGAPSITGRMVCLETPAGGVTDIDLYAATEGTAVFDDGIAALTETAIVTAGGAWAVGLSKPFIASILADKYLYLTGGAAGTAATYTAGRFMIEIEGYYGPA